MPWVTPKTDWQSIDYFNAEDYNRLKNNTQYIYTLYNQRGFTLPTWENMGPDKAVGDLIYKEDYRKILVNLRDCCAPQVANNYAVLERVYEEITRYVFDDRAFIYTTLNNLESAQQILYDILTRDPRAEWRNFTYWLQGNQIGERL